jgi:hypothetical protein
MYLYLVLSSVFDYVLLYFITVSCSLRLSTDTIPIIQPHTSECASVNEPLKTYGICWYREGGNSGDSTRNNKIGPVA